ncbi:oxidoreductase C-terminal domain-containing protein [Klebsiella quasipneumoniae]|nr:hypothetical protein KAM622c_12570 [Klebsiella quasipneumoniae subsp. quasipneumoniae]
MFQLRDGVLTGAVTLNHGREIRTLRKLIQSGQAVNAVVSGSARRS